MSDDDRWTPFRARQRGDAHTWHVLHEGIPPHLEPTLRQTIIRRLDREAPAAAHVQRRLRLAVGSNESIMPAVVAATEKDPELWLDIADCLLDQARQQYVASKDPRNVWAADSMKDEAIDYLAGLMRVLDEADSAYKVEALEKGSWQLVRRVDETATAAVEDVVARAGSASGLIASAWSSAFRRDPDLDGAFRSAVLAVESAACTVLTPKDQEPSLGKAIGHLRNTLDRWTVASLDDKAQASAATLLGMLETVWQNHQRHVGQGGTPPEPATQDETEAVLFLAVTLVQWFDRGYVTRRP